MSNFLQLFFAKTFILFYSLVGAGLLTPPTTEAPAPTPEPVVEIKPAETKIETKIVIQDLAKDKINKYESDISTLKNQVLQWQSESTLLKTRISQTYKEVKELSNSLGWTARIYPNDAEKQNYMTMFAVIDVNMSPVANLAVRMLKQEYNSAAGYVTAAENIYVTDSNGFVKNLNINLERDGSGKLKYYYKFFNSSGEQDKALFNFPSGN